MFFWGGTPTFSFYFNNYTSGAGKTYTLGNVAPEAIGMIPRSVAEVFKKANEDPFNR